jgi:hypothetical protein
MFKSEFSGKQIEANVTPVKVVTHKRYKVYTQKDKYNVEHEVGRGWEIVKELMVAPEEVEAVKAKFGEGVYVNQPAPTISVPVYSSGRY